METPIDPLTEMQVDLDALERLRNHRCDRYLAMRLRAPRSSALIQSPPSRVMPYDRVRLRRQQVLSIGILTSQSLMPCQRIGIGDLRLLPLEICARNPAGHDAASQSATTAATQRVRAADQKDPSP